MFINHNLKETASTVLQWLLIRKTDPIQSNPWMDSIHVSNSTSAAMGLVRSSGNQ